MIVGYCPGVFDLLHHGHLNLILKCKEMCDKLIIGVHTDEFVESYKRVPKQNLIQRMENLIKTGLLDKSNIVSVGNVHYDIIVNNNVKYVFHGSDWEIESYKKQIRYYEDGLDKLGVEIKIIEYSKGINTTSILSKKNKVNLKDKNCFIFDMDNTLVIGDKGMNFSSELVNLLINKNINIYLVTNNNYYTIDQIYEILKKNNININYNNIITPLLKIKNYLLHNKINNIYVWGSDNSKEYLSNYFNLTNIYDSEMILVMYNNNFNYKELSELLTCIKNKKKFIISNIDLTYPDKKNIYTDTGIIYEIINKLTKENPERVFGKPNINMLEDILRKYEKKEIIFIGDSELTDKKLAESCNIDFLRIADNGDISNLGILIDYFNYF